jgi:biotin carboxyl carrier protein
VAPVTDRAAARASLARASARPDIPTIVVQPDVSDPELLSATPLTEGGSTVTYRLERAGADRLVIIDDADPAARTAVILEPIAGPRQPAAGPGRTGVDGREVLVDGWRFEVEVEPAARAALREKARRGRTEAGQDGPVEVRAIIPGVVVAVSVAAGDRVTTGQQLLVVEAMKMQNELRSPRDGVVGRLAVGERQTIEVGDLLAVVE